MEGGTGAWAGRWEQEGRVGMGEDMEDMEDRVGMAGTEVSDSRTVDST